MKILITGGTGFIGQYLYSHLSSNKENDIYISSRKKVGDIYIKYNNYEELKNILESYKFDKIFHLTAQSSVSLSWKIPFETLYDNINDTINLLNAVTKIQNYQPKILLASTAEIYAVQNEAMTEDSPLGPRNPYAYSKLVTDYFVTGISKDFNLNTVLARLFNTMGPGQTDVFVISSFAKQLAEIKLKLRENTIFVGNLAIFRDFIDVRDVVRAYDMISNEESFGEVYNICSGKPYKISDILDTLVKISGLSVNIELDKNRLRKTDIPIFYGSYEKINKKFGWKPQIPMEQTLEDMYNWWIDNLRGNG